jgi:hypothetical protein
VATTTKPSSIVLYIENICWLKNYQYSPKSTMPARSIHLHVPSGLEVEVEVEVEVEEEKCQFSIQFSPHHPLHPFAS